MVALVGAATCCCSIASGDCSAHGTVECGTRVDLTSVDEVDTVEGVVTVHSPDLLAVGAAWDDGPKAGEWIVERLAPFSGAVGHAVPLGYPAYAVVPIPFEDELQPDYAPLIATDALVDLL